MDVMRKVILFTLSIAVFFAACKKDEENPSPDGPDTPSTDTTPAVDSTKFNPNSYRFLKTYVDRSVHPDFKFSGALDVNEFHNNTNSVRDTVTAHFDEIVAGNAMKYGSVVGSSGQMNFTNVKRFVEDAKKVGLTIYGHTLAWHSQQQPGCIDICTHVTFELSIEFLIPLRKSAETITKRRAGLETVVTL